MINRRLFTCVYFLQLQVHVQCTFTSVVHTAVVHDITYHMTTGCRTSCNDPRLSYNQHRSTFCISYFSMNSKFQGSGTSVTLQFTEMLHIYESELTVMMIFFTHQHLDIPSLFSLDMHKNVALSTTYTLNVLCDFCKLSTCHAHLCDCYSLPSLFASFQSLSSHFYKQRVIAIISHYVISDVIISDVTVHSS